MWKASRYSMDADFILNGKKLHIRDVINKLIDEAYEEKLITEEFNQKAKQIVSKNSISKDMIELYKQTNDLEEIERLGVFK